MRQKGTLGRGFFFRAGGNHFRGDGERGGSAVFRPQLSPGGPREAPEAGGPGWGAGPGGRAGAGAAQEKQFPPALLSFFIYNPRFGPREGEVSGAGPRAGVRGRQRAGGRGAAG